MNCPNGYYNSLETVNLLGKGNLCLACDTGCLKCIGSSIECTSCGNITATNTIYYKDLKSNTCDITCPDNGQYLDIFVPNFCVKCSD